MKQTATEWLFEKINDALIDFTDGKISAAIYGIRVTEYKYIAKEMEREQMASNCSQLNKPTMIFGEHKIQMLEISDDEIHKAATNYSNLYYEFRAGAEWYREQLKQKING